MSRGAKISRTEKTRMESNHPCCPEDRGKTVLKIASEPRAGVKRGGCLPRCRLRVATGCTGRRGSREPGFEQARRQTKFDLRAGRLSATKMRALRGRFGGELFISPQQIRL